MRVVELTIDRTAIFNGALLPYIEGNDDSFIAFFTI